MVFLMAAVVFAVVFAGFVVFVVVVLVVVFNGFVVFVVVVVVVVGFTWAATNVLAEIAATKRMFYIFKFI